MRKKAWAILWLTQWLSKADKTGSAGTGPWLFGYIVIRRAGGFFLLAFIVRNELDYCV